MHRANDFVGPTGSVKSKALPSVIPQKSVAGNEGVPAAGNAERRRPRGLVIDGLREE